jgi:hypothetical protein
MTVRVKIWLFNKQKEVLFLLFLFLSSPLISQVTLDSTNLPIIIINTNGQIIPDDPKIEVDLGIIYNGPGEMNYITDSLNNYNGKVGIEIRGNTSMTFPKKSYSFETRDTAGCNLNVSLIDLPEENDWILYAPYSDKSLMRNVLMYELSNKMGRYASRTRFCELILNDEYKGVYVLMEKIKQDENRVDIADLTPNDTVGDDLTGGYIIKLDRFDGDGWHSNYNYLNFYEYYYPDDDDILDCQKQYIEDYFTIFEDSMAVLINSNTNYEELIEVASFIDFVILNELSKNIDAYRLSTYFHKDKTSNGGKLCAGPLWDYNIAFGNCDYYYGYEISNWIVGDTTYLDYHPFWWIKLFNNDEFRQQLISRWTELRESTLDYDSISNIIVSNAIFLNEAQERNFSKWDILGSYVWPNYFIGNNYQEEVNYLKLWIGQRILWMDENLDISTTILNKRKNKEDQVQLFPNPFSSQLTIQILDNNKFLRTFTLYDLSGKMVTEIKAVSSQNDLIFNTTQLQNGFYFYEVQFDDLSIYRGKLIKK